MMRTSFEKENENKKTLAPIPKVGEEYWFYLNGQIKAVDEMRAKVTNVYTYKESETLLLPKYDDEFEQVIDWPLADLWLEQSSEFFWLYAKDTDYIIETIIPDLCSFRVFFARTVDGEWHAFETMLEKQFGLLDVTGEYYANLHKLS